MIYLDNASTTKPSEAAKQAAIESCELFGNPSSLHRLGLESEKRIRQSRERIAFLLDVNQKDLFFTSGGTEANNMAVLGGARANARAGNHVVTTQIEHPSVLEAFAALEEAGFEVTYIPPAANGSVTQKALEDALRPDTVLVSMMYVNNETGAVQPVELVKPLLREKAPKALFHIDAVQGFCKLDCHPRQWGADFVSISGHKVHALKGIGALYMAGRRLKRIHFGGGQQEGIRPGTENVSGILSFGAAVAKLDPAAQAAQMTACRQRLWSRLQEQLEGVQMNGDSENNAGSILNVSFQGIKAEILLHALEARGIYVSTGSACSTHKPQPSHVLKAMGRGPAQIAGAVRFSFDGETTIEMIDEAAGIIINEVKMLQRVMR